MPRPKPYARSAPKADVDGPWKHDLHHTVRATLADRISSRPSTAAAPLNKTPTLLARISNSAAGIELLPSSGSKNRLYGFEQQPGSSANAKAPVTAPASLNAGRELLPASSSSDYKSARPTRASNRPRGPVEAGQRNLVASSLGEALPSNRQRSPRNAEGGRRIPSPPNAPSPRNAPVSTRHENRGKSVSIIGAGRTSVWVRVERLARGTTAEDVRAAFSPTPIHTARITSRSSDRTVTVELEAADLANAESLVKKYDGVMADGETLRLSILGRVSSQSYDP